MARLIEGVIHQVAVVQGSAGSGESQPFPTSMKDGGPLWDKLFTRFTSADQSGSDATLISAIASKKVVITDLIISVAADMRVDIKEETSATVLFSFYMPKNGTIQITPRIPLILPTTGKAVLIRTSAAGSLSVTAMYYGE